ncbi:hypothetical protein PC39_09120 [Salinisphaera sp. PC39]|uniref:hypothetical protein n=1 Tax=Salinisphaera sp. PC39 TaxID=1304156 RepID=UPI00333FDCE4
MRCRKAPHHREREPIPDRGAGLTRVLLIALSLLLPPVFAADTGFSGGITLEPDEEEDNAAPSQPSDAAAPSTADGTDDAKAGSSGIAWWRNQPTGAALRLNHAGAFNNAPGGGPAIALLFTGRFDKDGRFNEYLSVYRPGGRRVEGRWRVAASDHVLYFPLPASGEYLVRLRAGLPDAEGNRLPRSLSGPVTIP